MPVVSNTSPLSNLAIIGRLELLQEQFGQIWIPPAVVAELECLDHVEAQEMLKIARQEGWLKVRGLASQKMTAILAAQLDRGEAEAIALAAEVEADWLLMDEREGRLAARQVGLHLTGVLGILMRAKLAARVASMRQEIAELRRLAHFFVKRDLELKILSSVGEQVVSG